MYERELLWIISSIEDRIKARPLFLGGFSGPMGGVGGPPGGFIGYLPQNRVAFDTTEAESNVIPPSGATLVDNLNRIRYRIRQLEDIVASGGGGGSTASGVNIGVGFDIYASGVGTLYFRRLDVKRGLVIGYSSDYETVELSGENLVGEVVSTGPPGADIIRYFGNPSLLEPRHAQLRRLHSSDNSIIVSEADTYIDFRVNTSVVGGGGAEKKYFKIAASGTYIYNATSAPGEVDLSINISGVVLGSVRDLIPILRIHYMPDNSSYSTNDDSYISSVWFTRSDNSQNLSDPPHNLNFRAFIKNNGIYYIDWVILEKSIYPGVLVEYYDYSYSFVTSGTINYVEIPLSTTLPASGVIPFVMISVNELNSRFSTPFSDRPYITNIHYIRADNSQNKGDVPEKIALVVRSVYQNTKVRILYALLTDIRNPGFKALESVYHDSFSRVVNLAIEYYDSIVYPFDHSLKSILVYRRFHGPPDNSNVYNVGTDYPNSKPFCVSFYRQDDSRNVEHSPDKLTFVLDSIYGGVYDTMEIDTDIFIIRNYDRSISFYNLGTGAGIFYDKIDRNIYFRSLKNTDGKISVLEGTYEIIIDNNTLVEQIQPATASGVSLINTQSGPVPKIKNIVQGSGILLNDVGDSVVISSIQKPCPRFVVEKKLNTSGLVYSLENEPSGDVQVFSDTILVFPDYYTVSGNSVVFNTVLSGTYLLFYYVTCDVGRGYGLDSYGTSSYGSV